MHYTLSAVVAGDQINSAFLVHSMAKERLRVRIRPLSISSDSSQHPVAPPPTKSDLPLPSLSSHTQEWQHRHDDDNQLLLNQTKQILSSISNHCTKENSTIWPLSDLNDSTTTCTNTTQKVVYVTLDDAIASFQDLFSKLVSTNNNSSSNSGPVPGVQRVSALRYKWIDNNKSRNNNINDDTVYYPTVDVQYV